jgi:RNA polymerase sigma-70 factor, ECF subfamily
LPAGNYLSRRGAVGIFEVSGMDSKDRAEREEMLRRAILAGDERAWHAWYDESFDGLYAYVLWRSAGRRDQADEVVQETWLTAVRQIRRFDPRKGSFLAWLRGLSVNVMRHHVRRQERNLRREQLAARNGNNAPRPEDEDRKKRISMTLDALPERQEEVLRAKYLEGLSVAEIATDWNETPKAVESLLSRAREAFRKIFARNEEG